MKKWWLGLGVAVLAWSVSGQDRYFTKTGHIYFISHTDLIDIAATHGQVASFVNIKTGDIVFALYMTGFKFRLPLAWEHFNENYVESHKYPKSTFKGKILNIGENDLTRDGTYEAVIAGDLVIHGVTRHIQVTGVAVVRQGKIFAKSQFSIFLDDFGIRVPGLVRDKVADTIPLRLDFVYEPYVGKQRD